MPRSILLGRPWPRPGEPLWLPEDLTAAVSFELLVSSLCPDCGADNEDWYQWITDHDGVRRRKPRNPPPYVIEAERCGGCAARENAVAAWDDSMEALKKSNPKTARAHQAGLKFRRVPWSKRSDSRTPGG